MLSFLLFTAGLLLLLAAGGFVVGAAVWLGWTVADRVWGPR